MECNGVTATRTYKKHTNTINIYFICIETMANAMECNTKNKANNKP